jgi:glutaryl-CoA dehydrogenase
MTRQQFGRAIGGFQLVQDLLIRMLGNITAPMAICVRLSQLQDQGLAHDRHSSQAKAFCTVGMRETVGYARELLGGNGSSSTTTLAGSSPTPRQSTPTRAPAR